MPLNCEHRKMLKRQITEMVFFFMLAVLAFMPMAAFGQNAPDQKALVEKAQFTLESFMADESMSWFHEHIKDARGMVIVPQLIKGAFFIGGSGGSGVLIAHDEKTDEWSYPAFVTLGGASFGFQFGGQALNINPGQGVSLSTVDLVHRRRQQRSRLSFSPPDRNFVGEPLDEVSTKPSIDGGKYQWRSL